MHAYLGEVLALATAVLWSFTSTFFTLAGQRVGSQVVNRVRLALAVVFMSLAHRFMQGSFFPFNAAPERWAWLAISAVIGLVIGDGLLFYAFTQIGARLSMLLMALAPVLGTVLAWLFLGERLELTELLAIAVTVGGVGWVVMERQGVNHEQHTPRQYAIGVLCGLGAALGQAAGLVMSKQGMHGDFPAVSASLIRVLAAALTIWALALFQKQARSSVHALRDRVALKWIVAGAVVGPTLGMTLSLAAAQLTAIGIASTLMALSPIIMLPLAHWLFHEKITLRASLGTVIAMVGVAMIFLW